MKKHIYNKQNGLHHTLNGDYCLPDLSLPEKEYPPLESTAGCAKPT